MFSNNTNISHNKSKVYTYPDHFVDNQQYTLNATDLNKYFETSTHNKIGTDSVLDQRFRDELSYTSIDKKPYTSIDQQSDTSSMQCKPQQAGNIDNISVVDDTPIASKQQMLHFRSNIYKWLSFDDKLRDHRTAMKKINQHKK